MWTDYESQQDYLNYSEVVENISELIRLREMLPISIGVYGDWGSGKSTILELLRQDLVEDDFLIINYDAWLFQGFDDAKASMMEAITESVSSSIQDNETLVEKAGALLKRVNYLRLFGMAAKTGISLATGSALSLAASGLVSASKVLAGDGKMEDGENIVNAAGAAGPLLRPMEETSPTEEICKFRVEFSELLEEMGKTVVVFVDNLDRCLPDTAIGILEAIHLFLFLPNTAFVIAADRDMVKQAVAKYYTEFSPVSDHISNYLDKIMIEQHPFCNFR
ncbi:P-loop NTPase fold protein [Pontiellaceae bacterium B12219]|nr:P-loop NTPase fold protein [Pontiellaceae bacterium B12219]